jgi:hypothetical protein
MKSMRMREKLTLAQPKLTACLLVFYSLISVKLRLTFPVVWTRARGAINSYPERPLVVIVSKRTEGISTKIMNHFANDGYKRWDRLCKNQAWVYLDLYFLFTRWDRVWGAVKHNLQTRTEASNALLSIRTGIYSKRR